MSAVTSDPTAPLGWRAYWADYSGWRTTSPKEPPPRQNTRDFPTFQEARAHADSLKTVNVVVSVTRVPEPKQGKAKK